MKTLPSNEFWGNRSGFWDQSVPKGENKPVGNAFRQKKWANGRENKNSPKQIKLFNVNTRWFR